MDLTTVFEDEYILAVDKPPGLLSVPGRGPDKIDCAVARAATAYPWVREVHRLDQPTSGLLVLAKTPESHRHLSMAFSNRRVSKTYAALTAGRPADPGTEGIEFTLFEEASTAGRISLYQHLDVADRPKQIIVPGPPGRSAVTEWRILGGSDGFCRLGLYPRTGRTHQLRLALAACGAPILGDRLYAPPEVLEAAPRLMLHAVSLEFEHPKTGGLVRLRSEPDF